MQLFGSNSVDVGKGDYAKGLRLQESAYGSVVPVLYGKNRITPNIIGYYDFTVITNVEEKEVDGPLWGLGGAGTDYHTYSYTYTATFLAALCHGQAYQIEKAYLSKASVSTGELSAKGYVFFNGSPTQSAWSHMTTKHPTEALAYRGLSYVGFKDYPIVGTLALPSYSYVVQMNSGQEDENPSTIIEDIINNTSYGFSGTVALNSTSFLKFFNYCKTNNLKISPIYNTQQPGADVLQGLTDITASEFVWSNGELSVKDYQDSYVQSRSYRTGDYGYYGDVICAADNGSVLVFCHGSGTNWKLSISYEDFVIYSTVAAPFKFLKLIWDGTQFLALGDTKSAKSSDGISWTEYTTGISGWAYVGNLLHVEYGYFVLCSTDGKYAFSVDGESWAIRDMPVQNWLSSASNGKTICCIRSYSPYSTYNYYAVTTDGVNWSEGDIDSGTIGHPEVYSITFNGKYFVCAGELSHLWRSFDGVTWEAVSSEYYVSEAYGHIQSNQNCIFVPSYSAYYFTMSYDGKSVSGSGAIGCNFSGPSIPYRTGFLSFSAASLDCITIPFAAVLNDDDFIDTGNHDDPIRVTRKPQSDAYNSIKIKCLNRANDYNVTVVEATDQSAIDKFGLRVFDTIDSTAICDIDVGRNVAQLVLQRKQNIRNTYEFNLGWKHIALEPMDVVAINDITLGLANYPVRIKEINEDENDVLLVVAEDFDSRNFETYSYASQASGSAGLDINVSPGSVSAPIIFQAPTALVPSTTSGMEIWVAVAGSGANWGGAKVHVSVDGGASYSLLGKVTTRSVFGYLTSQLLASADPDNTHTFGVDLSASNGSLATVTDAEADLFNTVCLIGDELVSYRDAVLTTVYNYNVDHLRRGCYNSNISTHAASSTFVKLTSSLFKFPFLSEYVGVTLKLKFQSFNNFGTNEEDLASCQEYSYLVDGTLSPSKPYAPTSLNVVQSGSSLNFSWLMPVPQTCTYSLYYCYGSVFDISIANLIASGISGLQYSKPTFLPGTYSFGVVAVDSIGSISSVSTMTKTIVSTFVVESSYAIAPFETGALTNCLRHMSGVIVPLSQNLASDDDWETFDQFVVNPFTSATYESVEIDLGSDLTGKIAWNIISFATPSTSPSQSNGEVSIDYRLAADAYDGFQAWTSGFISARYVKVKTEIKSLPTGCSCLSELTTNIGH